LGHEQGDLLIGNSSKLIEEIFSQYGKCIRMGGDEFTVILEDVVLEKCEKLLKDFRNKCAYPLFLSLNYMVLYDVTFVIFPTFHRHA
jgi:GGDEF domain-containing protein